MRNWMLQLSCVFCFGYTQSALSQDYVVNGDFTYRLENGRATITKYTGTNRTVIFPAELDGFEVWKLGEPNQPVLSNGFTGNYSVTNLVIPDTVRIVERESFIFTFNLVRVTFGNAVERIGSYAFEDSGLRSVEFPNSLKLIDPMAFWDCVNLTNVVYGSGLTNVAGAFNGATNVTQVAFKSGTTAITRDFLDPFPNLDKVILPEGLTSLETAAFAGRTNLTNLTLPSSLTQIAEEGFANCVNLDRLLFLGNAPTGSLGIFSGTPATIYYTPTSTGWSSTFFGRPTVMLGPTPTILAPPSASSVVAGQSLASSTLTGGSSDVPGSFAFVDISVVPPLGSSSQTVVFQPSNSGGFNAITFDVSVVSLSAQLDSDGDGLVDAAEHLLSFLGLDWQVAQPHSVSNLIKAPNSAGLYTSSSIMDLRMDGILIQKQGTNATISFQPQTTTDLTLPFTNNGTPINHQIPMPGNKGFIRIRVNP